MEVYPTLRAIPVIYGGSALYMVVMQQVCWFPGKSIIGHYWNQYCKDAPILHSFFSCLKTSTHWKSSECLFGLLLDYYDKMIRSWDDKWHKYYEVKSVEKGLVAGPSEENIRKISLCYQRIVIIIINIIIIIAKCYLLNRVRPICKGIKHTHKYTEAQTLWKKDGKKLIKHVTSPCCYRENKLDWTFVV